MTDERAKPAVPLPPGDPALPALHRLLDPGHVAGRLTAFLAPGAAISSVTIERVAYRPGVRCQVTFAVTVGGGRHTVVATTSASTAAGGGGITAPSDGPVARLAGWDADLAATIHWLPEDPWLPALSLPEHELAAICERAGLDVAGSAPRLLSYRPGERAVLGAGPAVLKLYSSALDLDRAVEGFAWSSAVIGERAPRLVHTDRRRRFIVQRRVEGTQLDHDGVIDTAAEAGGILRELHASHGAGGPRRDAPAILAEATLAADLAARLAPDLADRFAALTSRLAGALPAGGDAVAGHGDFNVSQIIRRASGQVVVIDFDEHGVAPPGDDVASYAANVVSGRAGDVDRAAIALERLVSAYGRRPPALGWHMSAALLRRAPSPFRLQKRTWPQRLEAILGAAEQAIAASGSSW